MADYATVVQFRVRLVLLVLLVLAEFGQTFPFRQTTRRALQRTFDSEELDLLLDDEFATSKFERKTLPGVAIKSVSFPSLHVRSGLITLHGSVVFPKNVNKSESLPGVVLVSGSGPNDRWETDGVFAPLRNVAEYLASRGFAVLSFDKRTCTATQHSLCQNVACTSPGNPSGCVNFTLNVADDFFMDAIAATQFLVSSNQSHVGVLDASVTVVGHSQGCTMVPHVAAALPDIVGNVVMLMGDGVTWDVVTTEQALVQATYMDYLYATTLDEPPSQSRTATLESINQTLATLECDAVSATLQMELILNGTLDANSTSPDACIVGGYVNIVGESVFTCPSTCGTGVCVQGLNTQHCITSQCNLASLGGFCISPLFLSSWFALGTTVSRAEVFSRTKARVLAINSWTDLLVVPSAYRPLHDLLEYGLPGALDLDTGTRSLVGDVTTRTFANLTHLMTRFLDPSSLNVVDEVLVALGSWICEDALLSAFCASFSLAT